jgi:hypothetical protein
MKNKIPNDAKEDFIQIGKRVGRLNKDHPDQVIQEVWDKWKIQFGNLSDWYDAFQNWKKGFLMGMENKN